MFPTQGAWKPVTVRGAGFALPGADRPCHDYKEFADSVMAGSCAITPFELAGTPIRVAGQVPGTGAETLDLPDRLVSRLPRASRLAHTAVANALDHAELTAAEISRRDAVLIVTSFQFALQETAVLLDRFAEAGPAGVAFDYWSKVAPGSIASGLCTNLGLDIPTLTLTGGCSTSLRGFELAASMVARGEVEYAVVVGADTILEPLYLSATGYAGRSGHRASSISDDPADVRPHDAVQTGNAPAEGAAATVLTSARNPGGGVDAAVEFIGFSSRNGGGNPMGLGDPKRCAADIRRLLAVGGVSLGDLAFFCDFAEGNRQLEDFLCETLVTLRAALADDAPLTLTSQEACYGHLPGAAGLLKVLASLVMLTENRVAPTANLVNPYPRLPARALAGSSERIADNGRRTAMTVGLSGGGDTTSLLLRLA
ncbi:beta-ketoacyl synthase N-terminal-like domain-containing protein [Amycolatopsis thermoflava]|uniref:beta-ketoacyl synthase N-terminal-like domain-containing protein n=1 Tax=Amycolatopsis thermoflava TaxID=84480 RepID=UPI003EC09144